MAASIIPLLTIALQAEPELVALVQSLISLRKKYPTLNPDQLLAVVQQITQSADQEFDQVLAQIAADQATPRTGAGTAAPKPPPPPPTPPAG